MTQAEVCGLTTVLGEALAAALAEADGMGDAVAEDASEAAALAPKEVLASASAAVLVALHAMLSSVRSMFSGEVTTNERVRPCPCLLSNSNNVLSAASNLDSSFARPPGDAVAEGTANCLTTWPGEFEAETRGLCVRELV